MDPYRRRPIGVRFVPPMGFMDAWYMVHENRLLPLEDDMVVIACLYIVYIARSAVDYIMLTK
jgi:hypothetical protein